MDEMDEMEDFDWRAFRAANKPKKNHKQQRQGASTKTEKPDRTKPERYYDKPNLVPRLNPAQQERAKQQKKLAS